jgi:hypothetical protein
MPYDDINENKLKSMMKRNSGSCSNYECEKQLQFLKVY